MRSRSLLGDFANRLGVGAPKGKPVRYESTVTVHSKSLPGVRFTIYRMSFARRIGLCRLIREMAPKIEFLESGTEFQEKIEANLLAQEIENLYLRWGLAAIGGLSIDGEPATAESLIAKGPDALSKEIAGAIQVECSLTEEERKN